MAKKPGEKRAYAEGTAPDRVVASVRAQIGNMIYNLSQESYPCEREAVIRGLNGVLDSLAAADAAAPPVPDRIDIALGILNPSWRYGPYPEHWRKDMARALAAADAAAPPSGETTLADMKRRRVAYEAGYERGLQEGSSSPVPEDVQEAIKAQDAANTVATWAAARGKFAKVADAWIRSLLSRPAPEQAPEPVASAESEGKWRQGHKVPKNLYVGDELAGQMQREEWATRVVEAVNALPALQADLIDARASLDECRDQRDSEASDREVFEQRADAQAKLIRTLAEALPVFAGIYQELDRQTYDDNVRQDFDAPDDFEHCLMLTAKMVRQFNKAFEQIDAALTQAKEAGYAE